MLVLKSQFINESFLLYCERRCRILDNGEMEEECGMVAAKAEKARR